MLERYWVSTIPINTRASKVNTRWAINQQRLLVKEGTDLTKALFDRSLALKQELKKYVVAGPITLISSSLTL